MGEFTPCRPKLASTTCPCCDTDYFMMGRLLAHLDRCPRCWAHVLELPSQPDEVVQHRADEERKAVIANQRAGRHRWAGPAPLRAHAGAEAGDSMAEAERVLAAAEGAYVGEA